MIIVYSYSIQLTSINSVQSAILLIFQILQRKRLKHDTDSLFKESVKRIDHRLLVIPLVFVLLRIWGIIQFFFTHAISYHWDSGCIQLHWYYIRLALGILEVGSIYIVGQWSL